MRDRTGPQSDSGDKVTYFTPEFIEILKIQTPMSYWPKNDLEENQPSVQLMDKEGE